MSDGVRVSSYREDLAVAGASSEAAAARNFVSIKYLYVFRGRDLNRHGRNDRGFLSAWHPTPVTFQCSSSLHKRRKASHC